MTDAFPPLSPQLLPAPARVRPGGTAHRSRPSRGGCGASRGTASPKRRRWSRPRWRRGSRSARSDIYGYGAQGFGAAELLLGRVFDAAPHLRGQMVLATEGDITPPTPYDSSPAWIARAIDDSLRRLRCERVELWQVHHPDVLTHPQEQARRLEDAHHAGKIGAIGVSNFTPAQVEALAQARSQVLRVPLASSQPEFSPRCLGPLVDGQLDQAMRWTRAQWYDVLVAARGEPLP